uniref:Uncharacterized protein n=1 Tax=Nymphaea colorata TaxID=210225 RepID=A0A5K1D3I9_9MAGN
MQVKEEDVRLGANKFSKEGADRNDSVRPGQELHGPATVTHARTWHAHVLVGGQRSPSSWPPSSFPTSPSS